MKNYPTYPDSSSLLSLVLSVALDITNPKGVEKTIFSKNKSLPFSRTIPVTATGELHWHLEWGRSGCRGSCKPTRFTHTNVKADGARGEMSGVHPLSSRITLNTSAHAFPTRHGYLTSPTFPSRRSSSTWLLSWTCIRERLWDGIYPTRTPNFLSWRRSWMQS